MSRAPAPAVSVEKELWGDRLCRAISLQYRFLAGFRT
ncbi:hypothetical protein LCGC14_2661060, partial [marine sediment metagenome]